MTKLIFCFTLLLTFSSCKKNQLPEHSGLIKDYTGLDGCGIMIDLDNGERLHPVSNQSGLPLEKDKRVIIKFRDKPAFNVCMAGQTVEIISLRYL